MKPSTPTGSERSDAHFARPQLLILSMHSLTPPPPFPWLHSWSPPPPSTQTFSSTLVKTWKVINKCPLCCRTNTDGIWLTHGGLAEPWAGPWEAGNRLTKSYGSVWVSEHFSKCSSGKEEKKKSMRKYLWWRSKKATVSKVAFSHFEVLGVFERGGSCGKSKKKKAHWCICATGQGKAAQTHFLCSPTPPCPAAAGACGTAEGVEGGWWWWCGEQTHICSQREGVGGGEALTAPLTGGVTRLLCLNNRSKVEPCPSALCAL